jgi:hypothetical protein
MGEINLIGELPCGKCLKRAMELWQTKFGAESLIGKLVLVLLVGDDFGGISTLGGPSETVRVGELAWVEVLNETEERVVGVLHRDLSLLEGFLGDPVEFEKIQVINHVDEDHNLDDIEVEFIAATAHHQQHQN